MYQQDIKNIKMRNTIVYHYMQRLHRVRKHGEGFMQGIPVFPIIPVGGMAGHKLHVPGTYNW